MGLVAHWPLEGNAKDEAFGNYDGTEVGGVSYGNGILSKSYDNTSGSGTGIQLIKSGDAEKFDNVFSWALWFKSTTTSGGNTQHILSRDNFEYAAFIINQSQSGQQNLKGDATGTAQVNKWHHVAFVHQSDQTVITYLDGVRQGTRSAPKSGAARPWVIGGNTEGDGNISGNYFEGKIDDVRFFDHLLSKAKVKKLAQGKISHWDFFDGNAYDSTIQKNHGTINGNPQKIDGKIGSDALLFDGSNDSITIQNSSDLNPKEAITVMAWVRLDNATDGYSGVVDKDSTDAYAIYQDALDEEFNWYVSTTNSDAEIRNIDLTIGKWHHIAGTYDSSSGDMLAYKDGSQVQSKNISGTLSQSSQNVFIGEREQSGYKWDGAIDDVRIYATALSQNEIQTIYKTKARLDENHRFSGHQLQESDIRYEWYDTQTYFSNNSHPSSATELDEFFDSSNSGVNVGGSGIHKKSVAWGDGGQAPNSKPSYLPADGFSWKVDGSIYVPETGTYTFGIDSSDASDVFINGTQVASFYGGHGFNGNFNNNGTINLQKGNHSFRARVEDGGSGDGIYVVWQKPSDSSFSTVPQENYLHGPSVRSTGKIESTFSEVGPRADTLLAWWKLNGNTKDFAGRYDATNNGAAIRDGVGQTAYFFDGSDYIRAPQDPYAPALDENSSSLTLSGWIRPTALNTNSTNHSIQNCWLAHSSGSFNDNMELGVDASTNDIQVYFNTSGSDSTNASTGVNAALDTWTHVIVTLNLNGTPTMKVYKNGDLQLTDTSTWSGTNGTLDSAKAEVTIGASRSFRNPFTGFIQNVRIYEKDMTDEQAAMLYEMSSLEAKMKKRPEGFYAPQFSETQL